MDLAEACEAGMVVYRPGGWKQTGFTCTGAAISYEFSRGKSVISNLIEVMPEARVDNSGDKAVLTRQLKFAELRDEQTVPATPLTLDVQNSMQRLGVRVAVQEEPPPQPKQPLPGEKPVQQPMPDWKTIRFEIGPTALPPTTIAEAINKPGVRIKQIVKQDNKWLIVGAMYAR